MKTNKSKLGRKGRARCSDTFIRCRWHGRAEKVHVIGEKTGVTTRVYRHHQVICDQSMHGMREKVLFLLRMFKFGTFARK